MSFPILPEWTSRQADTIDHYLDMLTGVFLNEKAARIRILGYSNALRQYQADAIIAVLSDALANDDTMPTPAQIRQRILEGTQKEDV